jgi:hypothetical protein
MRDRSTISNKIFEILKGSGFYLQMFDDYGMKTIEPTDADRFFATKENTDLSRPDLDSYSFLVCINDTMDSIDIKTPTAKKIGKENYADIKQLVSYIKTAVGLREDILVHWATFNRIIRPRDEVRAKDKTGKVLEEQELYAFLNQFTVESIFILKEDQIDSAAAKEALEIHNYDYDDTMSYLIAVDQMWRAKYESDPKAAFDLLKQL